MGKLHKPCRLQHPRRGEQTKNGYSWGPTCGQTGCIYIGWFTLTLYRFWDGEHVRAFAVALLPYVSYERTFIKTWVPSPLTVPPLRIVWLRQHRAILHFTTIALAVTLIPSPLRKRECFSGYTHTRPMCVTMCDHFEMYWKWRRNQSWLHNACWLMDYRTPSILGVPRGDTA